MCEWWGRYFSWQFSWVIKGERGGRVERLLCYILRDKSFPRPRPQFPHLRRGSVFLGENIGPSAFVTLLSLNGCTLAPLAEPTEKKDPGFGLFKPAFPDVSDRAFVVVVLPVNSQ
jgi:hypothetical protein